MSWFNLNDSLNNIKGQITSFATDVLADETELKEAQSKIKELEDLCAAQQVEIENLRASNTGGTVTQDGVWSWTTTASQEQELKRKIQELEESKKDLESSLVQLDLDCQQSIDKLVTLKDNLQRDYNNLEEECDGLREGKERAEKRAAKLEKDVHRLKEETIALKKQFEKIKELEDENTQLKKQLEELQPQKKEDMQNHLRPIEEENLAFRKQLEELKEEKFALNRRLDEKNSLQQLNGLKEQLDASISFQKALERENHTLKQQLEENPALKTEIKALQIANASLKEELAKVRSELETRKQDEDYEKLAILLQKYEERVSELETANLQLHDDVHKKYINILVASMKTYVEGNDSADFLQEFDADVNMKEYAMQVESVLKLLVDFKLKTESLEKELYDLREEKAKIVAEKNHEIEKLLKNSEILSQEVITKTQTIKDYENECSELMRNNDLLINELEGYKNSSGLQTISESNEDNMVLLETQVENANKKINDLECTVAALEKQNEDLEKQHEVLVTKLNETESLLEACNSEKEELKASFENKEYTCTELNVMQDGLKEEIEKQKKIHADLTSANKNLEACNKEYESKLQVLQKTAEELHAKLLTEEEKGMQLQVEKNNLMEKLQSFKMAETSLKLHFNKELQTVFEAKQELESKLSTVANEHALCQENVKKLQERNAFLEEKHREYEKLKLGNEQLLNKNVELLEQMKINENNYNSLRERFEKLNLKEIQMQNEIERLQKALEGVSLSNTPLDEPLKKLTLSETKTFNYEDDHSSPEHEELKKENSQLQAQLNELIGLVNSKQQENITYHAEIQRLNQILLLEIEKNKQLGEQLQQAKEEIERLQDQNGFLQGKCDVLTQNLLQQQSNEKELERLRAHLVEIEESYTQELLQAERKNQEMQAKMNEIEEREKNSSTLYTSVSIRANQQVEALQNQIQLLTSQRDELRKKISDAEDENSRQAAALTNLNFVLQQFQRDKENDVRQETERIRRQIRAEKQIQQELQQEIASLKAQLEDSRQGLQAATRLGDQLEFTKKQNVALKEEGTAWRTHVHEEGPRLSKLQEQLKKSETKYKELTSQTDGRVDKTLIKNLVIGLITANNNLNKDQYQILKIIATVLDFNQQEHDKVNLNKIQHSSWLSSLLHPQNPTTDGPTAQSLSEAFVKFLENESKPKVIPNLLDPAKKEKAGSSVSTPRQSPIVLNEVVLPTFSDFGQSRNSSSILKDVLKDNS